MLESMWAAFVKKFAGGDSVSKLVCQRAERSDDFAKVHRRDATPTWRVKGRCRRYRRARAWNLSD
jgi:hypothetical protein